MQHFNLYTMITTVIILVILAVALLSTMIGNKSGKKMDEIFENYKYHNNHTDEDNLTFML